MKNEIIEKVFEEFYNKVNSHTRIINIPIIQKDMSWDLEDAFHYDNRGISGVYKLIEKECTEDSYITKHDKRYCIVMEYKRQNKEGNQPRREIYVGEFIEVAGAIVIRGDILSYAEYCNSLVKNENEKRILKLNELDEYKKAVIDNLNDLKL